MSSASGFSGIFCPACDKSGTPTQLVRQMAAKQEGMLLKCPTCSRTYSYAALMDPKNLNPPRKVKLEFTEKQPAGFITLPLWLHPEVVESLRRKFPSNLLTTLSSAVTALADPDSVLIEGEYAREMASIGIRRGREVLSLAKEVKELRDAVAAARLREETLAGFFRSLGLAMPQPAAIAPSSPSTDNLAPPMDAAGNVIVPPHVQFSQLRDDGSGLLVPADGAEQTGQFTFPTGAAPAADARPGFVTGNLR